MTKTFVTKLVGTDYRINDRFAICAAFVESQLGNRPKHLAVRVSKQRFHGSKRVFVSGTFAMWKWNTPNDRSRLRGTYINAMDVLEKHGFVTKQCINKSVNSSYTPLYFKLHPLTSAA